MGETAPGGQPYTLETLKAAIAGSGLTAAEHYEMYGSKETTADGHLLNPSNAFDANAYVAAKLAQLQSEGSPEAAQWEGKTVVELVAALQAAGISPVTHYIDYGAAEATSAKIPLVQTVPSEQRVANDPAREAKNEVVPTNYNPATPAPGDAKPAPVTKPADVAQKVDASVSPAPIIPEKSAPVPGDDGYVAPPVNIKDTVANPVIPPSSTDAGTASGNWMVVNPDKGTGTIISQDGTIKGEVKVEITPGTGGSTVVIPPAEDKPVDKLPPATTLPPSVTPDPDKPGNVTPPTPPSGGDGGSTPATDFTVTPNGTVLTFGGNATGDVTISIGVDGKPTFTCAGKTAAPDISWTTVTAVTVGAGRSLKVAYADLDDTNSGGIAAITGNVTVSDELGISVANANTLDGKVSGVIKATITETAAATLEGLTDAHSNNAYTITVKDVTADAAKLKTIDGKTTVPVTIHDDVKTISGSATDVAAVYAASGSGFTGLGDEAVTLAVGTAAAADLNAIDAATTGVVTATAVTGVSGSAADLKTLLDLATVASDKTITLATDIKVNVTDSTGTLKVTDLNYLEGKNGSGTFEVDNAVTITGASGDWSALTATLDANTNIVVTGALDSGDLTTILGKANGTGTVTIDGSAETDALIYTFSGATRALTINGGAGNDSITGGTGNDTINGGSGDDTITGGAGDDTITGGAGNDTITGGAGNDTLTGGAGDDTFVFAAADFAGVTPSSTNLDTITDWSTGTNKIDFDVTLAIVEVSGTATSGSATISGTGVAGFHDADKGDLGKMLTAVAKALNTSASGSCAVFENEGNSYLFVSNGNATVDAGDALIKLTGVAATGIAIDASGDITGFTS